MKFPTFCAAHRSPRIPESPISEKSSAPGSEAVRDKWLVQEKSDFREKVLPQAAKLPGTSGLFKKKSEFSQLCPRQRSCPGQVACSKKVGFLRKKFCPRQRSCPGQVARSRESEQPLQPRAWSAFLGGPEPPGKQGGAGGRSPPTSRPPNLSHNLYSNSRSTALAAAMLFLEE